MVGQRDVLVAARALQHPAASPTAPPALDRRVFGRRASDINTNTPRSICGNGGGRARVGAAEPAAARVAEFSAIHRVWRKWSVGDNGDQLLSGAELRGDQQRVPADPPESTRNGHMLVRDVPRSARIVGRRFEQVRQVRGKWIGPITPPFQKLGPQVRQPIELRIDDRERKHLVGMVRRRQLAMADALCDEIHAASLMCSAMETSAVASGNIAPAAWSPVRPGDALPSRCQPGRLPTQQGVASANWLSTDRQVGLQHHGRGREARGRPS